MAVKRDPVFVRINKKSLLQNFMKVGKTLTLRNEFPRNHTRLMHLKNLNCFGKLALNSKRNDALITSSIKCNKWLISVNTVILPKLFSPVFVTWKINNLQGLNSLKFIKFSLIYRNNPTGILKGEIKIIFIFLGPQESLQMFVWKLFHIWKTIYFMKKYICPVSLLLLLQIKTYRK